MLSFRTLQMNSTKTEQARMLSKSCYKNPKYKQSMPSIKSSSIENNLPNNAFDDVQIVDGDTYTQQAGAKLGQAQPKLDCIRVN